MVLHGTGFKMFKVLNDRASVFFMLQKSDQVLILLANCNTVFDYLLLYYFIYLFI